jgi:hypothetical protein
MEFFLVEPEVAAALGERTTLDQSVHPPAVGDLHLQFEGWLGDSLLETFPCFVVTLPLAEALSAAALSGFTLDRVEVSTSEQFVELHPELALPEFQWLRPSGQAGQSDFGLSPDNRLVVSQRALSILQGHSLKHADIEHWPGSG